jgi:hypothetical protein
LAASYQLLASSFSAAETFFYEHSSSKLEQDELKANS